MSIRPLAHIERAFLALLVRDLAELAGDDTNIGGDYAFDPGAMPWYIRIEKVPGGRTDRLEGSYVIDVDVFSSDYDQAETVASALEALVLGAPHVVSLGGRKVVIDSAFQNVGIAPLPWEDDSTHRLGATYVLTARRS